MNGNPVFRESTLANAKPGTGVMTLDGIINKTGILLLLCMAGFCVSWYQPVPCYELIGIGLLGGIVLGVTTCFLPQISPFTSAPYAFFEGLLLGGVSAIMEQRFPLIAMQAATLTFGTLVVMLALYRLRIIVVTEKLRSGIIAATGAVAVLYLASFTLSLCGIQIPYMHSTGPIGIVCSLLITGVAAANLLLDFDFIESGVSSGAPKYLEWYAAFGLLVTLVWLYIRFLRLLSRLRGRS